jgi:hypothetical protein
MAQPETQKPSPAGFSLSHDAWGRMVLVDAQGVRHIGVEPVRAFPISDPDHWVSICDAEGRELVCVEDLAKLEPALRQMLVEDLARHEFVPVIQTILGVSADADPSHWEVETDRGRTSFLLNSEDDIRRLGPHKALVIDAQGIRFLIPDIRKLDASSRRLLERYL